MMRSARQNSSPPEPNPGHPGHLRGRTDIGLEDWQLRT